MTYPYVDLIEEAESSAVVLAAPEQLAGGTALRGYSLVASCEAEIAQLERARCRLLEYHVVASGDDRALLAVALSAVTKRSRQLQRSLERFRPLPVASSRTVRP